MSSRRILFFDGFTSETTPTSSISTGPTGATGADGDMTWEGTWVSGAYTANQAVHYAVDGKAYVCHTNTTSDQVPTDTNYWDVLAEKGDTGATGAAGSNGTNGTNGLVDWQGTWSSGAYTADQSVYYSTTGQSYICILDTTSDQDPTNGTYWDLMVQKGDTGDTGAAGTNGTNGTDGADGASAGSTIESKAADFTAANHTTYLVSSAASRNITLPAAAANLEFWVKDSTGDCNTNNFTIVRAGSEEIEGIAANKTLQTDWGSWHFICDGTNWFMING